MNEKKQLAEEQKELFEKSGAKNDWVVGLFFIIVFLIIVGINIFCRYSDSRKLEAMEYARGVVTSRQEYNSSVGRKTRTEHSITVEYTPDGSDKKYSFRDSDGPYEFIHKGDILGVYYEKGHPDKGIISKTDWLTGWNVRAEINYEAALIVAIFPLGIGVFFFIEEMKVRSNIKKGKFKLKKSDGLYPDENLHEIARMSNYKRSWLGAWIGMSLLYVLFMVMGIAMTVVSFNSAGSEKSGPLFAGIFFIIMAQGAAIAVFFTVKFVAAKKRNFIKGFMADDATLVYKDRKRAANVLWKHVKHFMEAETMWSRYKYDYSRLWLEKYEDKLDMFLDKDTGATKQDK